MLRTGSRARIPKPAGTRAARPEAAAASSPKERSAGRSAETAESNRAVDNPGSSPVDRVAAARRLASRSRARARPPRGPSSGGGPSLPFPLQRSGEHVFHGAERRLALEEDAIHLIADGKVHV